MLISSPLIDPLLFERLSSVIDAMDSVPELGVVWHYAALLSLLHEGSRNCLERMVSKWVPELDSRVLSDCKCILESFGLSGVGVYEYAHLVSVWRYNSFGHHTDLNGLCMYDITSYMSHSCGASAVWHFGENDAFCLRARVAIRPGDEVCISYLSDEELFRSTPFRREKTAGWLFECQCTRCQDCVDYSRGFRCDVCSVGSLYYSMSTCCDTCNSEIVDWDHLLELENLYVERVTNMDTKDLDDVQLVHKEALNLFTQQHWIIYFLTSHFAHNTQMTQIQNLMNRITFLEKTFPLVNYTTTWLIEELADLQIDNPSMTIALYEKSYWMMRILCGPDHPFTESIHTKLNACSTPNTHTQ